MSSPRPNPSTVSTHEEEAERFVPERDGPDLAYEHVHRYLLAARLLKGLRVLDLAAGSTFGARLLADGGCHVTTLDLDRTGLTAPLPSVQADARQLPFRDGSFEAVVCFEAIEHMQGADRMLAEIERILGGRAILLASTPDRALYTDRAGHQNPHHVAELSRSEFEAVLKNHFAHVEIAGQGLWAGSWISTLEGEAPVSARRRRRVDATTWPTNAIRASDLAADWTSPGTDELPAPVYLVAACSNSKRGWNRIHRSMASDSILHDPAQWLLAHYARLLEENTRGNDELGGQIVRARLAQTDLVEQLSAARRAIDEHEENAKNARTSMDQLERQIRESRSVADRQCKELERAKTASDDQQRQIDQARALTEDMQAQLELAARAAKAHEEEIARAREENAKGERARESMLESFGRLEAELERAELGAKDLEAQIEAARVSETSLESQLESARTTIQAAEAATRDAEARNQATQRQIEEARVAAGKLETWNRTLQGEVRASRLESEGLRSELAAAASSAGALERQIDEARVAALEMEDWNRTLHEHLEAARSETEARVLELTRAAQMFLDLEARNRALVESEAAGIREAQRLEEESAGYRLRIERLERDNARLWARIGHRLSSLIDGIRGRD